MSNNNTPATDPTTVKLIRVRLRYQDLFTAKAQTQDDGTQGEAKFTMTVLLDKIKQRGLIDQCETAIKRAALDRFHKAVPLNRNPLHDGNEKFDKVGFGDEVMFLNASASLDERPAIVDRNKSTLIESDGKIYWGCWVNASVRFYGWGPHPKGGRGVTAKIRWVQYVEDGPRFKGEDVDVDAEVDALEPAVGEDVDDMLK